MKKTIFISGSSNKELAKKIATNLNMKCFCYEAEVLVESFFTPILEKEKPKTVIVIQSFSLPDINRYILEMLEIIYLLKDFKIKEIYAIIPWLGYSLQDKTYRNGEPISAKVIANLFSNIGVDHVILCDLHNPKIMTFFTTATTHLLPIQIYANYIRQHFNLSKVVLVSPDAGGKERVALLGKKLAVPVASIDKSRDIHSGNVFASNFQGNVKGKIAIVYDDGIMTGSTLYEVVKVLRDVGAILVYFFATQAVLVGDIYQNIDKSGVDGIFVSNTILPRKVHSKIKVLDISSLFSEFLQTLLIFKKEKPHDI